jgi:ElaB/YqjD/DUF883 family membrane-anchored ribosome-binding protein
MTDPTSTRSGVGTVPSATEALRSNATDAMAKLSNIAQQAVGEAKKSASSLALAATERAKGAVQDQISSGADLIAHVAASTRVAARDLDPNAPQIASFVREAADRMDEFSRGIREKSVDELIETSSDFARRQPAVLFGAAAAVGFLLFRMIKTTSSAPGEHGGFTGSSHVPPAASPHAEAPPKTSGQLHGP